MGIEGHPGLHVPNRSGRDELNMVAVSVTCPPATPALMSYDASVDT